MNISERDKKLLAILAVVATVALYYRFIFTTQSTKIQELYAQKEAKETQLTQTELKISKIPTLNKTLEEEKAAIMPLAKKYLSDINQEDLILLINEYESKSSIKIEEVSFKEAEQEEINNVTKNITSEQESGDKTPQTNNVTEQQPTSNTAVSNEKTEQQDTPDFMNTDNIRMTNADIKFSATYSDLASLINILDTSSKNIVSNKLEIKKKDDSDAENISQVSDEMIEGTLNLQFFKVESLKDYEPVKESALKKEPIKRSVKNTPIMGYPWAVNSVIEYDKSTGKIIGRMSKQEYDNKNKVSGTPRIPNGSPTTNNNTDNSIGNNVNPNIVSLDEGSTKSQKLLEYKKPLELVRFDSINDIVVYSEDDYSIASLNMSKVADINYKIIREDIEFSKESDINSKVIVDVSKKNIVMNEKPESIVLNTYISKSNGYEIGLLFDTDGVSNYLPFVEKLSFIGWKELELNPSNVKFPSKLTGIYVKRVSDSNPINGNLYIDSLYANYIQSK